VWKLLSWLTAAPVLRTAAVAKCAAYSNCWDPTHHHQQQQEEGLASSSTSGDGRRGSSSSSRHRRTALIGHRQLVSSAPAAGTMAAVALQPPARALLQLRQLLQPAQPRHLLSVVCWR
jgi:hypothetical protein